MIEALRLAGSAATLALALHATALAQGRVANQEEASQVREERGVAMKTLGRHMRTLKHFTDGRGSESDAREAATAIIQLAAAVPKLFPAGTGEDDLHGSEARSVIWQRWGDFVAAADTLGKQAAEIDAAIRTGDAGQIRAAFSSLGSNGCKGCHSTFRKIHRH